MKKANKIGWTLYWLGMISALGGLAALELCGYREAVKWSVKFDVATALLVGGLAMMMASIIIDLISFLRNRGGHNE